MRRLSLLRSALGAIAGIAVVSTAHAAPMIWRCGNTYSDRPCDGGKAIEADPAQSAERRREADEATRKNITAGNAMERERMKAEAAQARRLPVLILSEKRDVARDAKPEKPPVAKKKKAAHTQADDFTAIYAPPGEKKKKKAKAS